VNVTARPKKSGLDYFPHDVDATTDPKLEPAIMRYGAAAYAFYFIHLEYCYRSEDLSIDVSATETGEEMRQVICRKLQISENDYACILQSLLRHGAFDAKIYAVSGKLTSAGIQKRAAKVLEKRARENERYKNISVAETAQETMAETPQSKANKRKEDIYCAFFEKVWQLYPNKRGKGQVKEAQKRRLYEIGYEQMERCIQRYKAALEAEEWRQAQNGSTFFNSGYVDYLDENYTEPEAGKGICGMRFAN